MFKIFISLTGLDQNTINYNENHLQHKKKRDGATQRTKHIQTNNRPTVFLNV